MSSTIHPHNIIQSNMRQEVTIGTKNKSSLKRVDLLKRCSIQIIFSLIGQEKADLLDTGDMMGRFDRIEIYFSHINVLQFGQPHISN